MIKKLEKFEKLEIGQEFECWGDTFINYDYPKFCKCIKINEDTAKEIDGIMFLIAPSDVVTIKIKKL